MTSGRTYLSIGDVLTLLRQEFPDVTISKIRFLESQGLVNPERTPSGYRKFYDHDVERLKWVLSQQREHFLPLKVIKGRLEDETSGGDNLHSRSGANTGAATRGAGGNGRLGTAAGPPGAAAHPASSAAPVGAPATSASSRGSTLIGLDSRGREAAGKLPGFDHPEAAEPRGVTETGHKKRSESLGASAGAPAGVVARPGTRSGDQRASRFPAGPSQGRGLHAAGSGLADGDARRATARTATTSATAAAQPGRHAQGRSGHPSEVPVRAGAPGEGGSGAPSAGGTGKEAKAWLTTESRSLTAAELAAASGLSESAVEELESYGILGGRVIGGVAHYDESEVVIARLASEFAQFGIEPRHLRLYKHASEREAGFVEQLVLPLMKQRNPEARNRAAEMVGDLTRIGQGLREALVRRNLKDLLGG